MNRYTGSIPIATVKLFQTGWNYAQDGPGNRLIFHFQGCNFDCPWCCNPEGRSAEGELFVRPELLPAEACPCGAVTSAGLNRDLCSICSARECLTVNRNQGIRFTAQEYGVEELVDTALASRSLFYDGGGVTVTGGEATLQFGGLESLLRELHKNGVHTALETNGSHRDLIQLLPHLDLLIFDLKHWDFSLAEGVLKNSGKHVLPNLKRVCASETDLLIRVTVVPGFNSSREDMERFAELFSSLPGRKRLRFELLYYHDYGKSKWESIGRDYEGPEEKIGDDDKKTYERIFASRNLALIST